MRMLVRCKQCRPNLEFAVKATNLQDVLEIFKKEHFLQNHSREHKWLKVKAEQDLKLLHSGRMSVADYIRETEKLHESLFVIEGLPETVEPGTIFITPLNGTENFQQRLKVKMSDEKALG